MIDRKAAAKSPLRWGLVGASNIARTRMVKAIRSTTGCEVHAVMSRDTGHGRAFANELDIPQVVATVDELLERVDVVYVSTSNDRHADVTLAAAAAGVHVLCEKPLSLKLEDAVEMATACDDAGVILATNHHMRGAATHRVVRDLVRSGDIGRPLAARAMYGEYLPEILQTWRTHDPKQGGVLYDLTVHNVDVLRFALDDDPVDVMSFTANSLIGHNGVEDQAQSIVRFGSGLLAYLHEAQCLPHHETALEVHGTNGSIYGRGILDEAPSGQVYLRQGSTMTEIKTEAVDLYATTVSQFMSAVRGGSRPCASGWDGVASLAAALAVRQSANTGQRVAIDYRWKESRS
jgi:1,5-anhydro-D-fructose reductase (1,5-anhydro-D-mannitol-forming)